MGQGWARPRGRRQGSRGVADSALRGAGGQTGGVSVGSHGTAAGRAILHRPCRFFRRPEYAASTIVGSSAAAALCRVNQTSNCTLLPLDSGSAAQRRGHRTGRGRERQRLPQHRAHHPSGTYEGRRGEAAAGRPRQSRHRLWCGRHPALQLRAAASRLPGSLAVDAMVGCAWRVFASPKSNAPALAVISLSATGDNDPPSAMPACRPWPSPHSPVADAGPGRRHPFRGPPKIQSDARGRWVVATTLNSGVGVARLTPAGWPDALFGNGGVRALQSSARTPYLATLRALRVDGGYPILGGRGYDPWVRWATASSWPACCACAPTAATTAPLPAYRPAASSSRSISRSASCRGLNFDAAGRLLVAGLASTTTLHCSTAIRPSRACATTGLSRRAG